MAQHTQAAEEKRPRAGRYQLFSDYVLVLCQKLHICAGTHDRQNLSGDQPPFGDP